MDVAGIIAIKENRSKLILSGGLIRGRRAVDRKATMAGETRGDAVSVNPSVPVVMHHLDPHQQGKTGSK